MTARLSATRLSKRFGARVVLDAVSVAAQPGEFVAVLGPSGAGKTTLFRCLTGLLAPDTGRIEIDGRDAAHLRGRERRQIGVVFQQFNLIGRMTALDNVLAGRLAHGPSWRGWTRRFAPLDRRIALDCLARVGIADLAGLRADRLSGGQQQRAAIARALAQEPRLIVADEPVASLDPRSSAGIMELLRGIVRDDGITLVCSLHQVSLARAHADRVIGLSGGRVTADCPAARFDDTQYALVYGDPQPKGEPREADPLPAARSPAPHARAGRGSP